MKWGKLLGIPLGQKFIHSFQPLIEYRTSKICIAMENCLWFSMQKWGRGWTYTNSVSYDGNCLCNAEYSFIGSLCTICDVRIRSWRRNVPNTTLCDKLTTGRSSWSWSYGSWIYNYLCNQYLLPRMLLVWIWINIM